MKMYPVWNFMQEYRELSKASNHELLYIGDSVYDMQCARNAMVDFALACWGASSREIEADYYLEKPSDVLSVVHPNRTRKTI